MPDLNSARVATWKQRFRRKYATDLPGLRTLSDTIAAEAGEVVTITSTSMEGGAGAGVVTGNKLEMLAAVEDVLLELDPALPAPPVYGSVMRFEPC